MTLSYQQVAPLPLEQEADQVAEMLAQHELQGLGLARKVFALHERFLDSPISRAQGFKPWLCGRRTDIKEGSISYFLDQGRALAQGITAPTATDLRAAGQLLAGGTSEAEVQSAVNSGSVRERAQSARNGGTISVPVPFEAHQRLKAIRDELRAGLNAELPEITSLCVEFTTEHARQFGAWLKERGA
ncbi:hypothetical protein [Deinococcus peraridilitoris]|uniref:Uncharacterized protein n=1 Tax=Deinococcus peraridilitoris (strain DSM 19664 / LMG 22246 / CIP 109416 / KR-200) TaxID=937777 RepID=L0A3G6_DEIPD|nr:hypothetical protein [Deinococcus peraridilitoris]AFZ67550.1 hypothetical protein Deipe_2054 [Deinococcus peraridilitoris DSM 19664]